MNQKPRAKKDRKQWRVMNGHGIQKNEESTFPKQFWCAFEYLQQKKKTQNEFQGRKFHGYKEMKYVQIMRL